MPLSREIRRQIVETLAKLNAGAEHPVEIAVLSKNLPGSETTLLTALDELSQFGIVIIEGRQCFLTPEGLELLDELGPAE